MTKEEGILEYKKYMDTVNRDGKEELFNWLVNDTDFFISPASTKYHGNYEGGLIEHSLNVLKYAIQIYKFSKKEFEFADISAESIIISSIHHDLCKIKTYKKEPLWFKHDDVWVEYEGYKYDSDFSLGHGEKSLFYLSQFMKLSKDEAMAIRFHMGPFDPNKDLDNAMKKSLVKLIFIADCASTLVEKTIDYKQLKIDSLNL